MDLKKRYATSEGINCNILQMVKMEPEWAANRIQAGEKAERKANRFDALVIQPLDLLVGLLDACKPYRGRKKGTPREECSKLNEVYRKCKAIIGTKAV